MFRTLFLTCVGLSWGCATAFAGSVERDQLRAQRRDTGPVVAPIEVEDDQGQAINLPLSAADRVTVAVFFSTWCPHCQTETPRLVQFVKDLGAHAKKVRVIGVRTAVEREREPYADFVARHKPNFPIYTDATMALAYVGFLKSQQLPDGLPLVAVIDRRGIVRYVLPTGRSDIAQELRWAVDDLLQ